MQSKHEHLREIGMLPPGNGWLLAEFGGETRAEAQERARECMKRVSRRGDRPAMELIDDPAQERKIWEVREAGLQRGEPVARGQRSHAARPRAGGERGEPARRRLLEQRDVPFEPVEHSGELVEQRPVDLDVRLPAFARAEQPRTEREEGGLRGEVSPVVEIPAEDAHWPDIS